MNPSCLIILIFVASATANSCNTIAQLEEALYSNGSDNLKSLNYGFFPHTQKTSRYLRVDYVFEGGDPDDDQCIVHYYWSVGGFLLIQPPAVFRFTSLHFSYPANDIVNIILTLPEYCRHLVYNNSTGNCSCENEEDTLLDILTQHVS